MKLTVLSALVAVLLASPCWSQSGNQKAQILMMQAVDAMGGAEAIKNVTNLSVRATCKGAKGPEFFVEVQSILPDRTFFRKTVRSQATELTQVTEFTLVGEVAWRRGPEAGALTLLEDPLDAKMLRQREIHLMLANLVERFEGHRVVGTEFRGSAPCTLMEMQDEWAQMGSVCFDQTTYLPMELNFRRPPEAGGRHVTITLDRWTKVGEVLFPVTLSLTEGSETFSFHYKSIDLGVVKPELFQIPPEVQNQLTGTAQK